MKKLPYSIEVNGSGEICSLVQEEQTLGLPSDWQLQQQTEKTKKMVTMHLVAIAAIPIQKMCCIEIFVLRL
jgi:hypothetical protein